jgi:hypothetical protein
VSLLFDLGLEFELAIDPDALADVETALERRSGIRCGCGRHVRSGVSVAGSSSGEDELVGFFCASHSGRDILLSIDGRQCIADEREALVMSPRISWAAVCPEAGEVAGLRSRWIS